MKFIPSRRHKTKKLIAKIWICIAILLIAIASVFLFSEKVHKIGMVENIKNVLVGQVKIVQEKIQSNTSDLTDMDEMLLEDENEMQQLNDSSEKNIAAYSEDIVKKTDNVTKTAFSQYVPYTNAKNIVTNGMAEDGSGAVVLTNENPTAIDVCYTFYWAGTFEGYSDDFQMIAVEKNTNPNVATATAISTKSDGIPCIQVNFTSGTETGTTTIEIGYTVSAVKKNIEDVNSDIVGFSGYISYTVTNDVSKDTEEIKISPPTDSDIKEFYNNNNRAVIVRCIDNNSHNASTSIIADNSYEIGEVEIYDGSNENLSTSEWLYMCKVYINQQYYLNLWHKNFQSSRGTHYLVDSTKEVIAPFYYFKGGYCTYAQTTLSQGWYCLSEDAPVYVDITQNVNNIKKSFILNYDANGGTNAPDSQSIITTSNNQTFIVSDQKPQRENYVFEGWSDNPGENNTVNYNIGSQIAITLESPTKTIYAVWREPIYTYTVTYTDGVVGEIVFPDQSYEGLRAGETTPAFAPSEGGTKTLEDGTVIPIRDGYEFMGWAPAIARTVSGDVTYTATWQKMYDLTIYKTPSEEYPTVGEKFSYTIKIINPNGKDVLVNVEDTLSSKLKYVKAGDGGIYDEVTHMVTWKSIVVPANGSKEVRVYLIK